MLTHDFMIHLQLHTYSGSTCAWDLAAI